jgi:hypothetical protein
MNSFAFGSAVSCTSEQIMMDIGQLVSQRVPIWHAKVNVGLQVT